MTSLLLLAVLSADPGRITVTVLPGVDSRSRLFVADLGHPWNHDTAYAKRMKRLRVEIDSVADVRFLDPLTPGGKLKRPAIRIGYREWEEVGDLSRYDRGGGVVWLRDQLDPWIVEHEIAVREEEYRRRCAERSEACRRINLAFNKAHPDSTYVTLGERNTRVVYDAASGCWCRLLPLMPESTFSPSEPLPFDPDDLRPAAEAPKPHPWRHLVPALKPVEATR